MLPKTHPKPYIRLESEPTELSHTDYFTWEPSHQSDSFFKWKGGKQGIKVAKRQTNTSNILVGENWKRDKGGYLHAVARSRTLKKMLPLCSSCFWGNRKLQTAATGTILIINGKILKLLCTNGKGRATWLWQKADDRIHYSCAMIAHGTSWWTLLGGSASDKHPPTDQDMSLLPVTRNNVRCASVHTDSSSAWARSELWNK